MLIRKSQFRLTPSEEPRHKQQSKACDDDKDATEETFRHKQHLSGTSSSTRYPGHIDRYRHLANNDLKEQKGESDDDDDSLRNNTNHQSEITLKQTASVTNVIMPQSAHAISTVTAAISNATAPNPLHLSLIVDQDIINIGGNNLRESQQFMHEYEKEVMTVRQQQKGCLEYPIAQIFEVSYYLFLLYLFCFIY